MTTNQDEYDDYEEPIRFFNVWQQQAMEAVENNNYDKLKECIGEVDFDFQGRDGNSLLYTVINEGKLEIAEVLLHGDANPNRPNSDNFFESDFNDNPFLLAVERGNQEAISLLKKHGGKEEAKYQFHIDEAINEDSVEKLKYVIDSGFNLNDDSNGYDYGKSNNGGDILVSATRWGKVEVAKYLVENGVDINYSINKHTGIFIDNAVSNGNLDLVKYLHQNGAEIDDASVIIATRYERLDMVKYLIENSNDQKQAIENTLSESRWGNKSFNEEVTNYITSIEEKKILTNDLKEVQSQKETKKSTMRI